MEIEASMFDDNTETTMTMLLSEDSNDIVITLTKVGILELYVIVPVEELKLALRKLTAR